MRRVGWTGLVSFNALTRVQAINAAYGCCSSCAWSRLIAEGRPYADVDTLFAASDAAVAALGSGDIVDALAGHRRIGENPSGEQALVAAASTQVRADLVEVNAAYEERFGYRFLIFANGRQGAELLAAARDRLHHDPDTELAVVRTELAQINRLRLEKMLSPAGHFADIDEYSPDFPCPDLAHAN